MFTPPQQLKHPAMPDWSHDDRARQSLQRTLREYVVRTISAGTRQVFEHKVKPNFEKAQGRAFKDRYEVREAMMAEPYVKAHIAIQRAAQELMWNSVTYGVERQIDTLIQRGTSAPSAGGSLTLDPDLDIPGYVADLDIHCMPGGYCKDDGETDLTVGAVYDVGSFLYGAGRGGPLSDGMGQTAVNYFQSKYSDRKPLRILDMGCTIGHSTTAWSDAYPEAEVHAIDVGAAILRYGHARAEHLGKPVHFSQQNAEATNFEDESFDVVVSHIMIHETSRKALPRIIEESRRLLKPGGVMLHIDAGQYANMDLYRQFIFDAEVFNNNEPFWSTLRDLDLVALAEQAGWPEGSVKAEFIPMAPPPGFKKGPSRNVPGFEVLEAVK